MNRWKRYLLRKLGVTESPRRTQVADVVWHRSEELRTERLGPDIDDLRKDQQGFKLPDGARRDPWRPTNSLG